jgi:hypothetical protein
MPSSAVRAAEVIRAALEEAKADAPVTGAAVFHRSGLYIDGIGMDRDVWTKISALASRMGEVEQLVKSTLRGFDIIFEDCVVVARGGRSVVVIVAARPGADLTFLDYLVFRLVEEIERGISGGQP